MKTHQTASERIKFQKVLWAPQTRWFISKWTNYGQHQLGLWRYICIVVTSFRELRKYQITQFLFFINQVRNMVGLNSALCEPFPSQAINTFSLGQEDDVTHVVYGKDLFMSMNIEDCKIHVRS